VLEAEVMVPVDALALESLALELLAIDAVETLLVVAEVVAVESVARAVLDPEILRVEETVDTLLEAAVAGSKVRKIWTQPAGAVASVLKYKTVPSVAVSHS
jgi:hypothetical protein